MRRINHFLPVSVRLGLAAAGILLIAGEVATARLILTNHLFTTLFQSYYLLAIGVFLFLVGLFASQQALNQLFGDERHPRGISGNPNPGMGETFLVKAQTPLEMVVAAVAIDGQNIYKLMRVTI